MNKEKTDKIFNAITSNGCREMDEERFHQAVNEALNLNKMDTETKLINELAENGTEKARELFLRLQEERIEIKERLIKKLNLINNSADNDISESWLDNHILNQDSEIEGVIAKHSRYTKTYGGVLVKTILGNYAIIKEHQKKALNNKGMRVKVKPHKDYYGTVMILEYIDNP